ncbi:MAG: S9 family peptidase [Bacteroidales bacterium]|nr:S9 family peptidase [Bacteroidales bacterium]
MKKLLKYSVLVFLAVCLGFSAFSQEKLLTLKDAVWMNPEIYPSSIKQLKWIGDKNQFSYVDNNKLISGWATSPKRDTILSVDQINAALTKIDADSIKGFPRISWVDNNSFRFYQKNKLLLFDVENLSAKVLNKTDEKVANKDLEKNNLGIAYTIDNNLFIALDSKQIQITNDEDKGIVNGQSVHRNEFGIHKGTFWSPKSNYLAFYRMDETMVTDYPLVDINKRIAELKNTKYPMAGMTSHQVTLGIYNAKINETIFVKTGEPAEQYLTNISWGPDEKYIYIAVLNRDQNHLKLNKYDVKTGEFIKTLFEEKSEKYVEPENGMIFLKTKSNQFIWFSERDGYNHLYLFNTDGDLIKQLTKGDWVVTGLIGFDKNEKHIYFSSTKESPLENNIYSVNLKTGKIVKISQAEGTHRASFSKSGKYMIDIYSSLDVTREYSILDSKGKIRQILLKNSDPLKDYNLGEMDVFTIKNDNDDELYCRLIKPMDFDPEKKYPVIIYVYGGPHAQMITNSWLGGAGLYLNYLAQQGYLVFTLDNRGSANRGFEFESSIFRNVGTVELEDQMKGVEYLKSLPFVDAERIGVDGWSYGGFMTVSMLLKNPGVFKAGVAGGPVIDWKYYEVMYGERYMDTPESNPDGYKNACLLNYAKELDDRLLIIHGTNDATVVWQNSLSFVKQCVDEGVLLDYFVYPGHGHNVRGKDRIHLYKKIVQYFDDFLK